MNRTIPLGMGEDGDDRLPARGWTGRASARDWLDEAADGPGPAGRPDHSAEMRAIAAQLAALSGASARPAGEAEGASRGQALRDAVAAIARRQADLDGREPVPADRRPTLADADPLAAPAAPREPAAALSADPREAGRAHRAGIDLQAEVSQTFARFSRDLRDAIAATDARPAIEALGRDVRQIGRAVDGIGPGAADALAGIGEQTREMRDILKSSTARAAPLDAVERQVASLESRLGDLGALPPAAAPPAFAETMAEVRALLDGFDPGAAMTALETRLGAITDRIERGLDARGPSDLIEGLSRRVDEIHASLRAQLAEAAADTKPLEGLVRSLSDRIGQAREASAQFEHLEAAVRDAAARIDGTAAGLDPRGVQAVEAQLARLGERLDRSEASLRVLDGVDQTLGELFAQFEVTRQVAIDAAETAARTAARDTLRAALQNPALAHRPVDTTAAVDQMARSIDDIRAQQDTAERRTQSALSDIRIAVDRLLGQVGGARAAASEIAFRPRPVGDAAQGAGDGADLLIEPGAGRAGVVQAGRAEPRFGPEPEAPDPAGEGDGPASFIAAARRAAQAAQASAAVARSAERRPSPRSRPTAAGTGGAFNRAKLFLSARRRPILLGLAALVLLVGALEIVKVGADPSGGGRTGDAAAPARARVAAATVEAPAKPADAPAAVLPPAAVPAPPPLPAFVAGTGKPLPPPDGIPDGLRSAAASGEAGAEYEVGLRYAEGRGVPRDPKQALAWFQRAASGGLAPAQYRLGSAYEKGVGVDRDPALAMGWYAKAADAGNIRAMHNLAVMSAEGAGGKPDYGKAAQWFGKASTYGVRDSQFNLAILYARGLGIEQSLSQSYTWFAIAAAEGDKDAGEKRDEVASKLDAKALAAAKAAGDAFHASVPPAGANDVAAPAGGWDGVPARGGSSAPNAKVSQL